MAVKKILILRVPEGHVSKDAMTVIQRLGSANERR